MKTMDEILKEQNIIKYHGYFKRAMKAYAEQAIEELRKRHKFNSGKVEFGLLCEEVKQELK